jgi:hypothetical protein
MPVIADRRMKAMVYKTCTSLTSLLTFSIDRRRRFLVSHQFGHADSSGMLDPDQSDISFLHQDALVAPVCGLLERTDVSLACFRDDVVFLILIYQRWIYRVDPTRVNEYGQVNEGMVEDVGMSAVGKKEETKKDK